jgi:very-short-patch-repair endonuclease
MREFRRTAAEVAAESILKQLGIQARCQVVIGAFYIADFIGYDRAFVLEIDGPSHNGRERYDQQRDLLFQAAGFTVIRIRNEDVSPESLCSILDLSIQPKQKINSMIWLLKY